MMKTRAAAPPRPWPMPATDTPPLGLAYWDDAREGVTVSAPTMRRRVTSRSTKTWMAFLSKVLEQGNLSPRGAPSTAQFEARSITGMDSAAQGDRQVVQSSNLTS